MSDGTDSLWLHQSLATLRKTINKSLPAQHDPPFRHGKGQILPPHDRPISIDDPQPVVLAISDFAHRLSAVRQDAIAELRARGAVHLEVTAPASRWGGLVNHVKNTLPREEYGILRSLRQAIDTARVWAFGFTDLLCIADAMLPNSDKETHRLLCHLRDETLRIQRITDNKHSDGSRVIASVLDSKRVHPQDEMPDNANGCDIETDEASTHVVVMEYATPLGLRWTGGLLLPLVAGAATDIVDWCESPREGSESAPPDAQEHDAGGKRKEDADSRAVSALYTLYQSLRHVPKHAEVAKKSKLAEKTVASKSRCPSYHAARGMLLSELPRGTKDKDGNIEAWNEA